MSTNTCFKDSGDNHHHLIVRSHKAKNAAEIKRKEIGLKARTRQLFVINAKKADANIRMQTPREAAMGQAARDPVSVQSLLFDFVALKTSGKGIIQYRGTNPFKYHRNCLKANACFAANLIMTPDRVLANTCVHTVFVNIPSHTQQEFVPGSYKYVRTANIAAMSPAQPFVRRTPKRKSPFLKQWPIMWRMFAIAASSIAGVFSTSTTKKSLPKLQN